MARFVLPDTLEGDKYISKYLHPNMTFNNFFMNHHTESDGTEVFTMSRVGPHGYSVAQWKIEGDNLAYDDATGTYSGTVTKVSYSPSTDGTPYNEFEAKGLHIELADLMADPEVVVQKLTADSDRMIGSRGSDEIHSGGDQDLVYGRGGNDLIFLGDGDDAASGGSGDDQIFGDDGRDAINGGGGNDYVNGGAGSDILAGGRGNDYLAGGKGSDILLGGTGHDFLDSGSNNDLLNGGKGNDTFLTGAGEDVLVFKFNQGKDTVLDFESGKDMVDLTDTNLTYKTLADALIDVPDGVLLDLHKGEVLFVGMNKSDFDLHDDFILS
ncbi:MAG: hypothetical protein KDJ19_06545 [Hyphomicrobiaceae bacterium]|nr:hypothetical protein [Hyphomicrobiaceae bacterium]MCC0024741.1 hypothetical protein [Hyphomicrobiaceae bacterium]